MWDRHNVQIIAINTIITKEILSLNFKICTTLLSRPFRVFNPCTYICYCTAVYVVSAGQWCCYDIIFHTWYSPTRLRCHNGYGWISARPSATISRWLKLNINVMSVCRKSGITQHWRVCLLPAMNVCMFVHANISPKTGGSCTSWRHGVETYGSNVELQCFLCA